MLVAHAAMYRAEPWRALVGFGGARTIFALECTLLYRKSLRIRRRQDELERQVAEAELT